MHKWALILLLFLASISVDAISVQNITHSSSPTSIVIATINPLTELDVDSIIHTYHSNNLFIMVLTPLSELSINDENHSTKSSEFIIKISTPLSSLQIQNMTHTTFSNGVVLNVTNSNITRFVSNNSKYYASFIKSINSSIPIVIGKNSYDEYLIDKYGVGLKNGFIKYYDKIGIYPFNAVIISATINGNRTIFIYGNAVEGEVAALRFLKNHKDEFIYLDKTHYLNDIDALSVYDYIHLPENQKYYLKDVKEFKTIVNKSLFGKFDERVIDVKTNDGVLLRVLKLEPKNSKKIKDYLKINDMPLVFAGGLWSNLYSWQNLGSNLADRGWNTYLIEITGGPGQDCLTCINYDYNDLVDSFFPSIIGTIQRLNNNSQIIYIGHSNGARTGISSLETYNSIGKENVGAYFNGSDWLNVSMSPTPIKTYIAVGMPGSFDGEQNTFGNIVKDNYNEILTNLTNLNKSHITMFEIIQSYVNFPSILKIDSVISFNLLISYVSLIKNSNDTQPIITNISRVIIITGREFNVGDGIVAITDQNNFFNNSKANYTLQFYIGTLHTGMADDKFIQTIIKDEISEVNNSLSKYIKGPDYRVK